MNKSVIFSLFLMSSLLMGTSLNMNMFSSAMADGKDRDDKRYQYDYDYNNRIQQSTYGQDSYPNSFDSGYGYDTKLSYDNPIYDDSQNFYSDRYSQYKTED